MDLPNLPEGTPVWATVVLALLMMFLALSERVAKLRGPLGAVARWWNSRQLRELQGKRDLDAKIDEIADDRVKRQLESFQATFTTVEAQAAQLSRDLTSEREAWRKERLALIRERDEEVSRLRHDDQMKWQYIVYVSSRLREYRLWAAENGHTLPPPDIPNYYKWLATRRARNPPDDTKSD